MRNAFAEALTELARSDERVVLLSGDIGNRLFDNYKNYCAERFLNCGVAEANMLTMAAGMASCGLRPVAYTITPFITTRCLEQIRVDVCYHNMPVIITGTGSGLSYASLGATHHSCEDIAFLRALPNMTVLCPADALETRKALQEALKQNGPVYIRLGKKGEPAVHQTEPEFTIGKALVVREGSDVCFLGCGTLLAAALQAAEKLHEENISVQVVSFHTVKPLDEEFLSRTFENFKLVATVEEHSVVGGFGSAVAEWASDHACKKQARLLRFGTADEFIHEAGNKEHALSYFGLTSENIAQKTKTAYESSSSHSV